jgi:hypothetical protein
MESSFQLWREILAGDVTETMKEIFEKIFTAVRKI